MPDRGQIVTAAEAPAAVGPYCHAVRAGDLLFISGQTPLEPSSGALVKGDVGDRARQCLDNLQAICRAAGTDMTAAVRCTVYVTDMSQFAVVNDAYAGWFGDTALPARVTVGVAALPVGADVEIEAVVALT